MRTYKVQRETERSRIGGDTRWFYVVRVNDDGSEVMLNLRFGDRETAEATARNLQDAQKKRAAARLLN